MTVSVHPAGWWGEEGECHTVPKKSLYFRLETNPVTDGADKCLWVLCQTFASASSVPGWASLSRREKSIPTFAIFL